MLTPITRAEVLAGCEAQMIDVTNRWLDTFAQCDIDHAVAKTAAVLRKSLRVKLPHAMQVACASTLDSVVTRYAAKARGIEFAQPQGAMTAFLHTVWRCPATA